MADKEEHIRHSYEVNAGAWTQAIRENRVRSRREVTNKALIDAIEYYQPTSLLDVGCGEGWLSRSAAGKKVGRYVGVDSSKLLIEQAQRAGDGTFLVLDYEHLQTLAGHHEPFDCIVCNFSLLGETSTAIACLSLASLVAPSGHILIQTVHPLTGVGDDAYKSGWRIGSWDGFGEGFTDPHPWYFRTFAAWSELFSQASLVLAKIGEPVYPSTSQPASVIFHLSRAR